MGLSIFCQIFYWVEVINRYIFKGRVEKKKILQHSLHVSFIKCTVIEKMHSAL